MNNQFIPQTKICVCCDIPKPSKRFFLINEAEAICLSDTCDTCRQMLDNFRQIYRENPRKAKEYKEEYLRKQKLVYEKPS